VLSLGIDYDRLWWSYLSPYGYIKKCDLVGWGKTNNPYFEDDKDLQNLPADDIRRCPFRNHVFILVTPLPHDEDAFVAAGAKVVDACAGPHFGTETQPEYLALAVDPEGDMSWKSRYGGAWDHPRRGIEGLAEVTSTRDRTLIAKMGWWTPKGEDIDADAVLDSIRARWPSDAKMPDSFDVQALLAVAPQEVADCKFDSTEEKPVKPVNGENERRWITMRRKTDFDSYCYLSFKTSVLPSVADAVARFAARAAAFTPPPKKSNKTMHVKDAAAMKLSDTKLVVLGNEQMSLFVYKNLLVEINGNDIQAANYLDKMTADFVAKLEEMDS
jgi:hypothetical protein